MRNLKIFDQKNQECNLKHEDLIRNYKKAIKMLNGAWNRFNYSATTSSIYHLKSCEEYLNEVIQDCVKNNVTYNKINVKTLED